MLSEAHIIESLSGRVFVHILILGWNKVPGKDPLGTYYFLVDRQGPLIRKATLPKVSIILWPLYKRDFLFI